MGTETVEAGRTSSQDALRRVAHGIAPMVFSVVRWCAFWILQVFRPVVVPILLWLAIGGLGLWVVFVPIAGDTEFPTRSVLGMSVGCGLAAVTYFALLEWLRPPVGRGR